MIDLLSRAISILRVRAENCAGVLRARTRERGSKKNSTLAARCRVVEEQVNSILAEIDRKVITLEKTRRSVDEHRITAEQAEVVLRGVLRSYRGMRRDIDAIEENFVGHISRFSNEDERLTALAGRLWSETGLPGHPPVAVTNTIGYFCTLAPFGIIFSPPSIDRDLLIFPDLYHEFGHILHSAPGGGLFGPRFQKELDQYLTELRNKARRTSRPIEPRLMSQIRERWIESWAEEVACDTLATCIVGPAFGWCNLNLCLKNSNAFESGHQHPADAARTRHMIRVLRRRGHADAADEMEGLWDRFLHFSGQTPKPYFNDLHPDGLFIAIMEDVESAIAKLGIGGGVSPFVATLNQAWAEFHKSVDGYYQWEKGVFSDLRSLL